ncbi:hypothetical protein [Methylocystis sp. B8]|uniref:hypothetical protein n=1 Tax=Methylocystis sp. B8 TaxID=544938 RepID=UPI0010FCF083|nr:hypothetical protein [Methylocystis sp. B8]TLG71834.1 hypothetical protein FEV16_15170 [Methylocystis sp. B8]
MKNILTATLGFALGVTSLTPMAPARADSTGAAIAAGVGGLAVGAIVGSALSRPAPPVYIEALPPRCWVQPRPLFDEYGEVIGSRPRRVCE